MNMKILSTEKHYDEALFSDDNLDAGDSEDVPTQLVSQGKRPVEKSATAKTIDIEQSSPFFIREEAPRFEKYGTSEDVVFDLARSGYRGFGFEEDTNAFAQGPSPDDDYDLCFVVEGDVEFLTNKDGFLQHSLYLVELL